MKKHNKIKLNNLESSTISDEQMKDLQGGSKVCGCSCYWESSGGSSTDSNASSNRDLGSGGHSTKGENEWTIWP